ncbi:MAG: hypothetical protein H6Q04_264 [Acidobacteria bacterium]|nr:hypothetical protein [Acidobacteriota bacterium]
MNTRTIITGRRSVALASLLLCFISLYAAPAQTASSKPRVVLMNDPELDDQNTVVRYLLYSSQFNTEGLVYTSSGVHWAGDGKGTKWFVPGRQYTRFGLNLCPCTSWRWKPGERFIDDAVDIYAKVYPNLKAHDPGYPAPDYLKSKIFAGNIQFDGDISQESPGSELVKNLLLDDNPGPVYLLTGGGQSTIARALKSIKLQYEGTPEWQAVYQKVSQKAIIQSFGDQDGTYASYIKPNWPDIQFRQMATGTWGYGARDVVLPQYAKYLTAEWMKANVSDVGPFGSFYRVWGDGKQMVPGDIFDHFGLSGLTAEELKAKGFVVWAPPQEKGSWISEGDTSIFMNLLDNGLRADENPAYGGWGGRSGTDHDENGDTPSDYATARWFGPAQQDFAARMRWTVTPSYSGANHAPAVKADGSLDITAKQGEEIRMQASAKDPDGNALSCKWWQYTDAGTYPGSILLKTPNTRSTSFEVPRDSIPGQTIHIILEVKDNGTPVLTSYRRFIVTVSAR